MPDLSPQQFIFTFDQDVTISSNALVLDNITTDTQISASDWTFAYDDLTYTATWTLSGVTNDSLPTATGILPDGNYRAAIAYDDVTNSSNQTMDNDVIFDTYYLCADFNRDRVVNAVDFNILAQNMGQSGMTFAQGDANYDGTVNGLDYNILAAHFSSVINPLPTGANEVSIAVLGSDSVTVTWLDDVSNEDGWRIQRSTDGQTFDEYYNQQGGGADESFRSYTWSSLDDGSKYWFRVRAYDSGYGTGYTPKRSAVTVLPAPTNVYASPTSATSVDVHWTDNSGSETGFVIEKSDADQIIWTHVGTALPNATSYAVANLTPGELVSVRVRAQSTHAQSTNSKPPKIITPPQNLGEEVYSYIEEEWDGAHTDYWTPNNTTYRDRQQQLGWLYSEHVQLSLDDLPAHQCAHVAVFAEPDVQIEHEGPYGDPINPPWVAQSVIDGQEVQNDLREWSGQGNSVPTRNVVLAHTQNTINWIGYLDVPYGEPGEKYTISYAAVTLWRSIVRVDALQDGTEGKDHATQAPPVNPVFRFSRVGATDQPLTLKVDFSGGTAVPYQDFNLDSGGLVENVTIPQGELWVDYEVHIIDDGVVEPNKIVRATIIEDDLYGVDETAAMADASLVDKDILIILIAGHSQSDPETPELPAPETMPWMVRGTLLSAPYQVHPDNIFLSSEDGHGHGASHTRVTNHALQQIVAAGNRTLDIGMAGYSHGAGLVHDVAHDMRAHHLNVGFGRADPYALYGAAYIDGFRDDLFFAEHRVPPGAAQLLNFYQSRWDGFLSPLNGQPIDGNVPLMNWNGDLYHNAHDHGTIDDSAAIQASIAHLLGLREWPNLDNELWQALEEDRENVWTD